MGLARGEREEPVLWVLYTGERAVRSAVPKHWAHRGHLPVGLWQKTTPRGFEPLRAEPNGFRVHLLNHSGTVSLRRCGKSALVAINCGSMGIFNALGIAPGGHGNMQRFDSSSAEIIYMMLRMAHRGNFDGVLALGNS